MADFSNRFKNLSTVFCHEFSHVEFLYLRQLIICPWSCPLIFALLSQLQKFVLLPSRLIFLFSSTSMQDSRAIRPSRRMLRVKLKKLPHSTIPSIESNFPKSLMASWNVDDDRCSKNLEDMVDQCCSLKGHCEWTIV